MMNGMDNGYSAQNGYSTQYRPISAWGYIGYNLLFAIPLVGFILLIVFAVSDANINRRNYARSFLCLLLIGAIITAIIMISGGTSVFTSMMSAARR